jgi:O-methyltransferase involved in polyketide biosynthesis
VLSDGVAAGPRARHGEACSPRRQYGLDIDGSEVVWDGERSHVGEYLSAKGWQLSTHTTHELHAANGFEFPGDDAVATFGSFDYLIAEIAA